MADVTVGAKLTLDSGEAQNSVKSFKQQLKEAQQEVVTLGEKFGVTSKEAANAAKRAAELRDQIGDAKSLVDAFNPDTKFRALGASINTVVGGFSALQGVLGLVGVESEETQKALLKVQSALAISQGVAQLQEGVQTFKNLGSVIQATTVFQKANAAATAVTSTVMKAFGVNVAATSTAFNVLKGAIIATGIGALVIGLTAVIQSLDLFSSSTDKAADAQARLKREVEALNEVISAEDKIIANARKLELAELRKRGATRKEIFDKEQSYREEDIARNQDHLDQLSDQNSEAAKNYIQQQEELRTEIKIKQIDFDLEEAERRKREKEKRDAELKAERERIERERPKVEKDPLSRIQGLNIEIPKTEKQLQIENEEAALLKAAATNQATKDLIANTDKEFTRIHGENVDQRIRNEEAELQAKIDFANAGISVLGNLSALVGKQTAAGKVLALAEIAAGTAVGFIQGLDIAQKSAKAAGPGAAFAFPIFYAQQIAAVLAAASKAKGILSGGGGSSTSVAPTPSLSSRPPLQPQKPQTPTTTLDQQSLNAINNATTRSYVLEADVSSNVERVKRLNRAARLGG